MAVLDKRALAELRLLDPDGRSELIPRVYSSYLKSLTLLSLQLTQARQQGDSLAMNRAVHTLKSSSASVGALGLSNVCVAVETCLRAGTADQLPDLLNQLLSEAARVEDAVPYFLSGQ